MNTEQIMHLLAARDGCSYDASLALEANKALQAAITELVQERDALRASTDKFFDASTKFRQERDTYKVAADKLAAENKVLRDALALAKDLTTIVRMPNVEYIADAHNKAVEKIQAALTRKQS